MALSPMVAGACGVLVLQAIAGACIVRQRWDNALSPVGKHYTPVLQKIQEAIDSKPRPEATRFLPDE